MPQKFFSVGKVRLHLDSFSPGEEKRRGESTKTITMTLRAQPFDAALASSIDEGLGGDSAVRAQLFSLTSGDPRPHLERVQMSLACPRQTLSIFAAPDIEEARLTIPQVKIHHTYARTQKDVQGYAFVFKATFGPVGRDELEFLQQWYLNTYFVSFDEAEPSLEFDADDADDDAGDDVPVIDGRKPLWDDGAVDAAERRAADAVAAEGDEGEGEGTGEAGDPATDEAVPLPKRRGRTKTGKHDPDAERARQVETAKSNVTPITAGKVTH